MSILRHVLEYVWDAISRISQLGCSNRFAVCTEANRRGKSPASDTESSAHAVWVYEDMDEQWKKFTQDVQATLEVDYSNGLNSTIWPEAGLNERQHTVNFKTQPMTYMLKSGDTVELSTVVERRVMPVIDVDEEDYVYVSYGKDDRNTRTSELQVDTTLEHPPTLCAKSTSFDHKDDCHPCSTQHNTNVRPSANRKKIKERNQDDDTAKHQSTHEYQSSTHDPDTMNTESTYVSTAQQSDKPSTRRRTRSNRPDQSDDCMEMTTPSLP